MNWERKSEREWTKESANGCMANRTQQTRFQSNGTQTLIFSLILKADKHQLNVGILNMNYRKCVTFNNNHFEMTGFFCLHHQCALWLIKIKLAFIASSFCRSNNVFRLLLLGSHNSHHFYVVFRWIATEDNNIIISAPDMISPTE